MRQVGLLLLTVVVVAAVGGWLYARTDAEGAARLLLGDRVEAEPLAEHGPGPDPRRPTSGPTRGQARCGVHDAAPSAEAQVATLAAGVVILHHRPDVDAGVRATLREIAREHPRTLVVPGEDLDAPVVGTAWRHRFPVDEVSEQELERFVVGWEDRGPDRRPCP